MDNKIIRSIDELPEALRLSLSDEEKNFIAALEKKRMLPFGVSSYYAALAGTDRNDPLRRLCIPDPREAKRTPAELDDPLGEAVHRQGPRFVHQYHDRILLLANGTCAGYCRHCFRRVWTGALYGFIGDEDLEKLLAYLQEHPEVREILISGGDPLMASDAKLEKLFRALRPRFQRGIDSDNKPVLTNDNIRPDILLRIGSRMPVVQPERVTPQLIKLFTNFQPLRLIVHINHPRELAPEVKATLYSLVSSGVPVHSQTVLLSGINDNEFCLAELFRDLLNLGVTPYYLFQGDLAPGTGHFRVPLLQGLALYRKLGTLISGLALPKYAVDLPGGGGKILLHEGVIQDRQNDTAGNEFFLLKDAYGRLWKYPDEAGMA